MGITCYTVTFELVSLACQVIMITGAESLVSQRGRSWMSVELRAEREEATM